jgi:hypothetical protein
MKRVVIPFLIVAHRRRRLLVPRPLAAAASGLADHVSGLCRRRNHPHRRHAGRAPHSHLRSAKAMPSKPDQQLFALDDAQARGRGGAQAKPHIATAEATRANLLTGKRRSRARKSSVHRSIRWRPPSISRARNGAAPTGLRIPAPPPNPAAMPTVEQVKRA